jgi:hypothetical protein
MSSCSFSRSSFRAAATSATANFFASCAELSRTIVFFRHQRTSMYLFAGANAAVDNSRAQGGLPVAEHTGPKGARGAAKLASRITFTRRKFRGFEISQGRGHFSLGGLPV